MASQELPIIHHVFRRFHNSVRYIFGFIEMSSFLNCAPSRRIWDVENKRKQKTVIVVKSKERGARTKVLSCAYSPDGGMIGGGELEPQILPGLSG